MIGYSIVLGVATLGTLTFAVYKLAFFVRRGLGTENIGTSVLSFEIVANARTSIFLPNPLTMD
jgi:hypothetical protein